MFQFFNNLWSNSRQLNFWLLTLIFNIFLLFFVFFIFIYQLFSRYFCFYLLWSLLFFFFFLFFYFIFWVCLNLCFDNFTWRSYFRIRMVNCCSYYLWCCRRYRFFFLTSWFRSNSRFLYPRRNHIWLWFFDLNLNLCFYYFWCLFNIFLFCSYSCFLNSCRHNVYCICIILILRFLNLGLDYFTLFLFRIKTTSCLSSINFCFDDFLFRRFIRYICWTTHITQSEIRILTIRQIQIATSFRIWSHLFRWINYLSVCLFIFCVNDVNIFLCVWFIIWWHFFIFQI